jgi:hypothetical protein
MYLQVDQLLTLFDYLTKVSRSYTILRMRKKIVFTVSLRQSMFHQISRMKVIDKIYLN